jgi:aminoglycoside phosphotransferase (APT) family kinase protein
LRYGLDHHRDRLSGDFAAVAEMYIDRSEALHALWQHGPSTVIHGDTHIGNLFDDHGRTGFLDWGIINVSTPMRDVSYFLNMAMAVEDRRAHDRDLIRHYLACRTALGGVEISFDDAWHAHRLHAAYTVPASCQVVTFPDDATPRRRVFADAFLARAEAALADLEVRDVLRAAGL